jgi:glycosyltransferase involved in cell wall biosynthesis
VVEVLAAMSMFSQKKLINYKIVFIIDTLGVGGAESQLVMLAVELHKRGYDCVVFALRAEGKFIETLESFGIPVINGNINKEKDRLALLRGILYLWRLIYKNRPCVVHAYLPLSNLLGSITARLAGASVVITSRRALGMHQEMETRWKYFDRISNALSSMISVNSIVVRNDTISRDGVDSNKLVCIYNGLDLSRFDLPSEMRYSMRLKLGLLETDFAWVKVANLSNRKGHVNLLQAFSKIYSNYKVRLFLVGFDHGIQQSLETITSKLGISDRVTFLGGRSDVPEILSAMDGYVAASHNEGFSNAILEAMASGLPIVATNVGGNAEALQEGQIGIVVEPNNPEALCSAMREIMNNKELCLKFSAAGKKSIREKYSVDAMVSSYLELYLREVERKSPQPLKY